MTRRSYHFLAILLVTALSVPARAQEAADSSPLIRDASIERHSLLDVHSARSSRKAFALSLILPGLGHRYVQDGHWRGGASAFALADAGLWIAMLATGERRGSLTDNYTTLAASRAGALVDGKDRRFFINLANYRSSEEYLDVQLRLRNWTEIDYVAERTNQWRWESEQDFLRYRDLRQQSETLGRRRSYLLALLAANRVIAGVSAVRAAGRAANTERGVQFGFSPPASGESLPVMNLHIRF